MHDMEAQMGASALNNEPLAIALKTHTGLCPRGSHRCRVLVLGVNPFEDLPGYQLLGILSQFRDVETFAAEDSPEGAEILRQTGVRMFQIPQPHLGVEAYLSAIHDVCERLSIDVVLPSTDAHLAALTGAPPSTQSLWPPLKWLASRGLINKWAGQSWVSRVAPTPSRWTIEGDEGLDTWESQHAYPVMVKGMRKGALRCADRSDFIAAQRTILSNPANRGPGGGFFIEDVASGTEHSVLLVTDEHGRAQSVVALRKLATTQLGTTLVAQTESVSELPFDIEEVAIQLGTAGVVELEFRNNESNDELLVFEANFRFPSWIGALGKYGQTVVHRYLTTLGVLDGPSDDTAVPDVGTLIYRLPESGFLPLSGTLGGSYASHAARHLQVLNEGSRSPRLLWRSREPHQFLQK